MGETDRSRLKVVTMNQSEIKRGNNDSTQLILRVHRSNGPVEELYVANGLSIGRSNGNTIALADDAVHRRHAQLWIKDGKARLCVSEADAVIQVGHTAVREIELTDGLAFRIGQTTFECVSGQPVAERTRSSVCPFCRSSSVGAHEGKSNCPACGEAILAVCLNAAGTELTVVPATYGKFAASNFVARGGMGMILKGMDTESNETVAIKLILPGVQATDKAQQRFKEELRLMGRVEHPNVVRLISWGRQGTFNYLVMEWIEGESLREIIQHAKREGKLIAFRIAYRWFRQVCKGLAAIHAVGVIHRDLKPSNLLVGRDVVARVSDLGLAKRVDSASQALTATGNVPGTWQYMAPEQLTAPGSVDQRADLYSLGTTFYELLTGEYPVGGWQPASVVNQTVPPSFDAIIARLLAPKPADRYPDVHEVLADFSSVPSCHSYVRAAPTNSLDGQRSTEEISRQDDKTPPQGIKTKEQGNSQTPTDVIPRTSPSTFCPHCGGVNIIAHSSMGCEVTCLHCHRTYHTGVALENQETRDAAAVIDTPIEVVLSEPSSGIVRTTTVKNADIQGTSEHQPRHHDQAKGNYVPPSMWPLYSVLFWVFILIHQRGCGIPVVGAWMMRTDLIREAVPAAQVSSHQFLADPATYRYKIITVKGTFSEFLPAKKESGTSYLILDRKISCWFHESASLKKLPPLSLEGQEVTIKGMVVTDNNLRGCSYVE